MAARTLPTFPNFNAGQRLTGAVMQQMTTWSAFWADRGTFRMLQSATQTFTTGVDAQITCDVSTWDSDSGRSSTTPFSYTIPSGWGSNLRWRFAFCIGWTSSAVGTRWCYLKQNGTAVNGTRFQYPGGGDPVFVGGTCSILVNGGDVISLWGGQTSGGNLNTTTINSACFLEGWLEGLGNP